MIESAEQFLVLAAVAPIADCPHLLAQAAEAVIALAPGAVALSREEKTTLSGRLTIFQQRLGVLRHASARCQGIVCTYSHQAGIVPLEYTPYGLTYSGGEPALLIPQSF